MCMNKCDCSPELWVIRLIAKRYQRQETEVLKPYSCN